MKHDQTFPVRVMRRQRGFSLVEVMVSLIIIAVGMLGLAKINALAYANTGVASQQSLAAIEAASMASAMRANHNYWSTISLATQFNYTANALVPASSNTLAAATNQCTSTASPCSITQVAQLDVQNWVAAVNAVLPNPVTTITCPVPTTAGTPPGCWIKVSWLEENVANNIAVGTMALPTYTLYVVP